jgi:hypothetical protein
LFLKTDGAGNLSFDSLSFSTPLAVIGNATAGSEIRLPEDTDNGSNYVALKAPDTIASNLTLTLPSADGTSGQVLQTNGSGVLSFASSSATNTPAFVAFRSATTQSMPNGSDTKVQFNGETFDIGSCFDSTTNFRFTPNVSGKYYLHCHLDLTGGGDSVRYDMQIQKNGSVVKATTHEGASGDPFSFELSGLVEANGTTDYFEIFFYQASSSVAVNSGNSRSYFEGFRIIE